MSTLSFPPRVVDTVCYEQKDIAYTEFTDGGSTAGTLTTKIILPVGFWIDRCVLTNLTGFTGDTSATIQVGDGSDFDRLTTGTPSVFTTATYLSLGAPSGTLPVSTAFSPVITITSGADFTAVEAGLLTIQIYGRQLN
jgi:hypothetical protein